MQVVGFKDETSLDNISREIYSKVSKAETNWEPAEGCFKINVDEEARDEELILVHSFWSKFSHGAEEKSGIVIIITY